MSDPPISHHHGDSTEKATKTEVTSEQKAQMEQAYQQMQRKLRINKIDEDIKHKIMVLSGKGGVGKSTVATGLALSLARQGKKVGIMDIDITGPNIPKMLGLEGTELHVENGRIHPAIGAHGIKVISMAFLIEDPDKEIISATGLTRDGVYIGNVMNWRPQHDQAFGNRPPTEEETNFCLPYLKAQLEVVQPKVIVVLGRTAANALIQPDPNAKMVDIRGRWWEFDGVPVMVTYHPSYLLHNPSLIGKRRVWEDFLLVMERLEMPISDKQRGFFE